LEEPQFKYTLSKTFTNAINRGHTLLEKKSVWPFDYYQAGDFFPVDYHYWYRPYSTGFGATRLSVMHAVAYADEMPFSADQMQNRSAMKASYEMSRRIFYKK
jgi:hypothetical protein